MTRWGAIFRDRLTFRPSMLAGSGLALLILSLLAQAYTSYILWVELDRRANWSTKLAVDFSREGSWQTSFRPIVSRDHGVGFSLRVPLEGDLADYHGKEKALPTAVVQHSLAGKEFAFSWQVLSQKHVVAQGKVRPSDLAGWATNDHARYQCFFYSLALKAGQEYAFTAQVEQANPAVNGLSPVLQVYAMSPSLKGHPLAVIWKLWHTFLFCSVGIALVLVAYVRHAHDRKLARR
jgi:hypothetical protein